MSECEWITGRLRAGPFAVADKMELLDLMAAYGIRVSDDRLLEPGDEPTRIEVQVSGRGCTLIATGMGVRAYFVDDEGLEVEREQLDDFLMEAVAPNTSFSITGRHQATPEAVTLNSAQCKHDSMGVWWEESRVCSRSDGEDLMLSGPTPTALDQILSTSMG